MKSGNKNVFHQGKKLRQRNFLSIVVLVVFFITPVLGLADTVSILSSSNAPVYNNLINTIKQSVSGQSQKSVTFQLVYAGNLNPADIDRIKQSDLLITVGRRAMLATNQLKSSPPILVTLVPSQTFKKNKSALRKLNKKISAIYLDSPPERQIFLARILLGKKQTLAFLHSDYTILRKKEIASITKKAGLGIQFNKVSSTENIARKLVQALEKSDALLALPDPLIFNRNTARNILLTTYRRRLPVIGFSSNYVKAGALAAAFSTPEQIAQQTSKAAIKILQSGSRFPYGGHFPTEFEIEINTSVARSLGINLAPKFQIKQELEKALEKYK